MVDDYVPVGPDGNTYFFKRPGNVVWVSILFKAWAKLHGSYEATLGGTPVHTFRDMTGAPCYERISINPDTFDRILRATSKKFSICATIEKQDEKKT